MGTYSLWLIPAATVHTTLARMIEHTSDHFGTPNFGPHVTLLDGLEGDHVIITNTLAEFSTLLRGITLETSGVSVGSSYYKCVFFNIKTSDELAELFQAARKTFGTSGASEYLPHLSMVYGELGPAAKSAAAGRIRHIHPLAFLVDRIRLMSTAGPTDAWFQVTEFALKRGDDG
jgi:2'-5' RNA ligase